MIDRVQEFNIRKLVADILMSVPAKNREVLKRRFGIDGDNAETLESIGKSYKITRERVRQIQEYGLKKLISKASDDSSFVVVFGEIESFIKSKGSVVKESDMFGALAKPQDAAHLSLLLRLMPNFITAKETDDIYARFSLNKTALKEVDDLVFKIHAALNRKNTPVSFSELLELAGNEIKMHSDKTNSDFTENVLALSKRIKKGPFESYGLNNWASIIPKGVRDKAHLVFEREKKPLHFKEISSRIDEYFGSQAQSNRTTVARTTHPQTVHNELIKDPRFVLIGRGLYALSEWGYEPGTVKDVLVQIFKESGNPITKEEILDLISERRFVKANTVFLNLQNKHYFKRLEDGKYYLA